MLDNIIKLGIPSKGRLREDIEKFLLERGLELVKTGLSREYACVFRKQKHIVPILITASDIPYEIRKGNLDFGITGRDLVYENILDWKKCMLELKRLDFGKADLVVGVPEFWVDVNTIDDLDEVAFLISDKYSRRMRVATKYQNLTRDYFVDKQITNFEIVESQGATEGAIKNGIADVIVDISSSGETLRQNKLKLIEQGILLKSSATIFANKKFCSKNRKNQILNNFLSIILGTL